MHKQDESDKLTLDEGLVNLSTNVWSSAIRNSFGFRSTCDKKRATLINKYERAALRFTKESVV